MKHPRGFAWLPILLVILGVLVVSGGAYWYVHSQNSTSQPSIVQLATTTPQSQTSLSGMSEYTDSSFGFSFWYPSGWTIEGWPAGGNNGPGSSAYGGTVEKVFDVEGGSLRISVVEVHSAAGRIDLPAGACGSCAALSYFFDAASHTWMMQYPQGVGGAPDMTQAQLQQSMAPTSANVSDNTMGGLHLFNGNDRFGSTIIPLSADNFLYIFANSQGEIQLERPLARTVVATDQSVATPVSAAQQIQTIQAEQQAYVGQ